MLNIAFECEFTDQWQIFKHIWKILRKVNSLDSNVFSNNNDVFTIFLSKKCKRKWKKGNAWKKPKSVTNRSCKFENLTYSRLGTLDSSKWGIFWQRGRRSHTRWFHSAWRTTYRHKWYRDCVRKKKGESIRKFHTWCKAFFRTLKEAFCQYWGALDCLSIFAFDTNGSWPCCSRRWCRCLHNLTLMSNWRRFQSCAYTICDKGRNNGNRNGY